MTFHPSRRKTVYRDVRMTRVTYDRNKKKYDMARTKQGARLMHEIGLCIKQGGYVEFEQRFDGYEEVADATLHWEAEQ